MTATLLPWLRQWASHDSDRSDPDLASDGRAQALAFSPDGVRLDACGYRNAS